MAEEIQVPARYPNEGHRWPRHKPVFTMLALLAALVAGLGAFAYQFKTEWSPLQRLYFPIYFRTAHLVSTRNRFLLPPQQFRVLAVVFPHAMRIALDQDVILLGEPVAASQSFPFVLSQAATQEGAKRLEWRTVRVTDDDMHRWLGKVFFGGRSVWELCRNAWYVALLVLGITLPLALRKDFEESLQTRLGRVLKGANPRTRTQYHRRTRHHTGIGWETTNQPTFWERCHLKEPERAMVRVARQHEPEHFLMMGDTGTGKSSLIRQLLKQVSRRQETAIIYDPTLEYVAQFFDPGRGDVILNPLDARMPYWSPSDEMLDFTEADTLAEPLFPDRDHENRFFVESPRKILAHLLKFHPTPQQIWQWIARPDPEIDKRVAGTPLEAIISKVAPQQRTGVLGVLERASAAFGLLPPKGNTGTWTATKWAERREGWIFISTKMTTRKILRPLMTLWLDFLILRLTEQVGWNFAPVWVILDELASLGPLPTLPLALAESRKSNVRMVLGFQGRSQVEANYGKQAEAMLSQPRTKIFLRTGEPHAAEWISRSVGEFEIERLREGRTTGDLSLNSSKNTTLESRIEGAILGSEVMNLEDLCCIYQTPGFTLRLSFPYLPPQKNQEKIIPAKIADPMLSLIQKHEASEDPDEPDAPANDPALNPRIPKSETGESQAMLGNT
jgi:Type IV secretion-system coupling protein DNA-binding domain